jgi:F0F1-type ATP synthase membrane subunit b/b'
MEATLQALGQILLKAVPTFLLVIFLHFYLKSVFFKPFRKMLRQRYEASEGARKLAEQSQKRAAAKAAEYEAALRKAKGEVYEAQGRVHRQLQDQQEAELRAARQQAEAAVSRARADLTKDVEVAKDGLAGESEMLAQQIAESILRRSAA